MGKEINIWFDKEADFLEVVFEKKPGHFRETNHDAVMEKVDKKGNLIGFSIQKVSSFRGKKPISVALLKKAA